MDLRDLMNLWKKVFRNWRYLATTILIALSFYLFNVFISSWKSLMEFYPSFGFFGFFKFFFMLAVGFKETIQFHSFVSIIIVSLLLGVLFSLIAYKVNLGKGSGEKTVGLFGGTGLFLAAFAPGCVACGVGLASALGIGAGFLSFFPYDGLELSIASITILVFAVVRVTKNMYICKTSPLMFNRVMKGGRKYE